MSSCDWVSHHSASIRSLVIDSRSPHSMTNDGHFVPLEGGSVAGRQEEAGSFVYWPDTTRFEPSGTSPWTMLMRSAATSMSLDIRLRATSWMCGMSLTTSLRFLSS